MRSIFGVPLQELTLQQLQEFLSSADEEPLLWEAKGDRHPDSIRKHVSGFANALGGWLILGADQRRDAKGRRVGEWDLSGVDFPDDEPRRWIGDVIRVLRPPPFYDVHIIDVGDGSKKVALVEVEPVPIPPCITPSGGIFERVAGKTVEITEPLVLLDLTRRGRELREQAAGRAHAHAQSLAVDPPQRLRPDYLPDLETQPPVFGLALAAVGVPPDITLRPFRKSFHTDQLAPQARERLWTEPYLADFVIAHTSQGASWVSIDGRDRNWVAFAHRDGTIALAFSSAATEGSIDTLVAPDRGPLLVGWQFAADMLEALGCAGEARCCMYFRTTGHSRFRGLADDFIIERPTDVRRPTDEEFEGVARELRRALGEHVPEPEPASDES